ncbi:hypothetical protein SAMN02745671_02630 [Anaerovibrio lipolyticus DSM 3074]|uniref:Gp37 protein n=2 Tax=Anaerovibrio lipolyticus TaxID=82374 RepID=A0A0B2K0D4_9FIRM|nr:hypothetical protein [Anaerovibrio lipolyticus]KHM53239.1 hypothetical protein NZ47_00025 [Anaerovibrio lipolyticus]SHJ08408.1 hypothetical protein SAMN02745671_02630 [Anaerovibrio lipolyticus DSM 3074]
MIIPERLINCLKKEIEIAVKDYRLKAENQEDKPVTVYAQHIPDENFDNDSYYPLVIVSLQKVEDAELSEGNGSTATIGLTIGVHGEDELAWMDLLSIMERIRQRVLIFRKLDKRFRLLLLTKWETIEAQPYPFWFGYGTLVYQIAQPNEQMDWDNVKIKMEDTSNE